MERKWTRSDSSVSYSVALITTPTFDFHNVISALTTPLTIPTLTPTPSLVKTSLNHSLCRVFKGKGGDIVFKTEPRTETKMYN